MKFSRGEMIAEKPSGEQLFPSLMRTPQEYAADYPGSRSGVASARRNLIVEVKGSKSSAFIAFENGSIRGTGVKLTSSINGTGTTREHAEFSPSPIARPSH